MIGVRRPYAPLFCLRYSYTNDRLKFPIVAGRINKNQINDEQLCAFSVQISQEISSNKL
jgi:hypothetical protein